MKTKKKNHAFPLLVITTALCFVAAFGVVTVAKSQDADPDVAAVKESLAAGRDATVKKADLSSASKKAWATVSSSDVFGVHPGRKTAADEKNTEAAAKKAPSSAEKPEKKGTGEFGSVTAIGDSVMLGAAPALQEAIDGIVVDAAESRQVRKGPELVKALKAKGQLGDTVIIALGTNGPFTEKTGQALIDAIGPDRSILWVKAYGKTLSWQDEVNKQIDSLAEKNTNITTINWPAEAAKHSDWFYNDGIHLKPAGRTGYAAFIQKVLPARTYAAD